MVYAVPFAETAKFCGSLVPTDRGLHMSSNAECGRMDDFSKNELYLQANDEPCHRRGHQIGNACEYKKVGLVMRLNQTLYHRENNTCKSGWFQCSGVAEYLLTRNLKLTDVKVCRYQAYEYELKYSYYTVSKIFDRTFSIQFI